MLVLDLNALFTAISRFTTIEITPNKLGIRVETICVIVRIATSPFSLFSSKPGMRTNQYLGRGDWAKIVLHACMLHVQYAFN